MFVSVVKVSFHTLSLQVSLAVGTYPGMRHSKEQCKLPLLWLHLIASMSVYTEESPCGEQIFSSSASKSGNLRKSSRKYLAYRCSASFQFDLVSKTLSMISFLAKKALQIFEYLLAEMLSSAGAFVLWIDQRAFRVSRLLFFFRPFSWRGAVLSELCAELEEILKKYFYTVFSWIRVPSMLFALLRFIFLAMLLILPDVICAPISIAWIKI